MRFFYSAILSGITTCIASSDFRLTLDQIYLSSGDLTPSFAPNVFDYQVNLKYPVDQLAITPKIDRKSYSNNHVPDVTMSWKNYFNGNSESSSLAVRRQIDLPDDKDELPVQIKVANPEDPSDSITYNITVRQASGKLSILKAVEGIDNNDYGVIVAPNVTEDDSVYEVYVKPEAKWVKMKFFCSGGSSVQVDGSSVGNGSATKIKREKDHHRQAFEVVCSKGSSILGTEVSRTYVVSLISDHYPENILIPRVVLNNSGQDCTFDASKKKFLCANPKDRSRKAQITGFSDSSIRYTVESPDKSVEVRMLDGISTIPFTYRNDLEVVAKAGRFEQRWPLRFEGGVVPGIMRLVGYLFALTLAVLLFALVVIIGSSNLSGIGVPFGATEIVTTITLLLQYLCFTCYMRGSNVLTDLVDPLRWVTLFWPLPWSVDDPAGTHHKQVNGRFESSSRHGLELWGDSLLGDATDVRNASGAMFYSCLIIGSVLLTHFIIIAIFYSNRANTFPHRLRVGHWESMTLHWLAFPACTGASMVIFHPNTTALAKGLSAAVFLVYFTWLFSVFGVIYTQVRKRAVTWVWQSSSREDGILESDSGYWCDVVCDQLTTSPVDRSFFGKVFKWKWISTVADVEPINIHPGQNRLKANDNFGPTDYFHHHSTGPIPIGKNPKTVEVVRTCAPPNVAPGGRLTTGLLRTSWLDILFTYQGLIALHNQVTADSGRQFVVPLTVKLHQLNGPMTGGSNAYFFDGARIPFVRIGDSLFRIFLGCLMGAALASTRHSYDATVFALIALLSGLTLFCVVYTRPYARHIENWLSTAVLGTISVSSLSFMLYALQKKDPSVMADILLWTVALLCAVLCVYSGIVIISVFSAIICPPLDEIRFLENIANCNLTISNHGKVDSWAVDVPAFTKYNCRSLKASCSSHGNKLHVSLYPSGEEPTLEFSVREIAQACKTGSLHAPVCCVVAPSSDTDPLGYRHLNIYDKYSILGDVGHFLSGDRATRHVADSVAQQIARQIEKNSRGNAVLIVTVIPPRKIPSASSAGTSSRQPSRASSSRRRKDSTSSSR